MGNFDDAVRWICPRCKAFNRPHATIIEKQDDGTAVCGQCRHAWSPSRRPEWLVPVMAACLLLLAAPASAQIPIDQVQVFASPDVRAWPATAQITRLAFSPAGVHVAFTKQDGPERWPDVVPPGWTGPLQYTLWLVLHVNGQWCASGIIEYWHGLDAAGGDVLTDNQVARNWVYDGRWGPMAGHQPAVGEHVGFFVTAGDQRGKDAHTVAERSSLIEIEWPAATGTPRVVWTEGAAPPQPLPILPTAPPVAASPVLASTDLSPVLNRLAVEAAERAEEFRALEAYIDARTAEIRGDIKSVKDAASNALQILIRYVAPIAGPIIAAIMARGK